MSHPNKLARWRKLLSQWRDSDQGISEFCRHHHVPVHQFYYWRDRVDAEPTEPRSRLVPVVVKDDSPKGHSTAAVRARLPNGVELQLHDCDLDQWLPRLAAL